MEWQIQPVDAVTFQPVMAPLDASSVSWERVLNGVGKGSFTVQTKARNIVWDANWWRDLDTPWKTILVVQQVAEDGRRFPVYAGWVVARTAWNPRSGEVTWETRSAWALLTRRFIYPAKHKSIFAQHGSFVYRDSTAAGACSAMIRSAIGESGIRYQGAALATWDRTSDPRYSIPLRFTTISGSDAARDRRFPHANDNYIADWIIETQGEDQGPDIDITPEWFSDAGLGFHVYSQAPMLARNTVKLSADDHPGAVTDLLDLSIVQDGAQTATAMVGLGAGQGSDMRRVIVRETDVRGYRSDVPEIEKLHQAKQVEDSADLLAQTRGALVRARQPAKAWSFNVQCGDTVQVHEFQPGTRIEVQYPGDLLEPAGKKVFTVLRVAGDLSQTVSLEIQEVD